MVGWVVECGKWKGTKQQMTIEEREKSDLLKSDETELRDAASSVADQRELDPSAGPATLLTSTGQHFYHCPSAKRMPWNAQAMAPARGAVPSSVLIEAKKKCVRSLFAFWLIYVEDKNLSASRRRHKNWPLTGQPSRALRSTLNAPALRQ
ncbi:hypothetical protein T4E_11823 [Trichinella pseudospiralis]|uniref:Uncharacterized protein n=1 Tax=Trichinella pseudospiralis TaxID=6337 RepID=A0A0V0Y5A1_TRIPS|nr:hypothetical protein T4E_11823 [Trichinella pseudospiralis]